MSFDRQGRPARERAGFWRELRWIDPSIDTATAAARLAGRYTPHAHAVYRRVRRLASFDTLSIELTLAVLQRQLGISRTVLWRAMTILIAAGVIRVDPVNDKKTGYRCKTRIQLLTAEPILAPAEIAAYVSQAKQHVPRVRTSTKSSARCAPPPAAEKMAEKRPPDRATANQIAVAVWTVLNGKVVPIIVDELHQLEASVTTWLYKHQMVAETGTIDAAIEHVRFQQQRRLCAAGDGSFRPARTQPRARQSQTWPGYRYRPPVITDAVREYTDLYAWRAMPAGPERDAARDAALAAIEAISPDLVNTV